MLVSVCMHAYMRVYIMHPAIAAATERASISEIRRVDAKLVGAPKLRKVVFIAML